jgi:hypothetical protein
MLADAFTKPQRGALFQCHIQWMCGVQFYPDQHSVHYQLDELHRFYGYKSKMT